MSKLKNIDDCDIDIESRRIEETKVLTKYAYRTKDPIALMACELDTQARRMAYHIEYDEEYEDEI